MRAALGVLAVLVAVAGCGSAASSDPIIGTCSVTGSGTYKLTLTNHSAASVEVNGFTVGFYDSSGYQTGSDQVVLNGDAGQSNPVFVVPGQPLTWTETPADYLPIEGGMTGQMGSACQLAEWYHP